MHIVDFKSLFIVVKKQPESPVINLFIAEMGTIDTSPSKTHIIAFPVPAKGHINPLFHFCNRLASKGFKITFITYASTYNKTVKTKASSSTSNIHIESIPDLGVELDPQDSFNLEVYFKKLRISSSESLTKLIEKPQKNQPKVVIYDAFMPWMLDVAHGLGLIGVSFFTQPCSVCAIYYHLLRGGTMKVPYLPPLESNDLPGFSFDFIKGENETIKKIHLDIFSNIDRVDYILFNTFDKLETEVANWMAGKWRIFTVGPTIPRILLDEDRNYLFETNAEVCFKWLDKRETDSVIYVSFGSFVTMAEEQMEEVAKGLMRSNCYFLWVVRDEEESKLPKDFKSQTSQKGPTINWCPQYDVLGHRAVACFMTHCGWNSTLEALCSGLPMIAVPLNGDQLTNAKFIADVWQVGIRVKVNVNGIVTSEEIERCIRDVTEIERGNELKRNAFKWKEFAKEAVTEGGSSDKNIEEFASRLVFN